MSMDLDESLTGTGRNEVQVPLSNERSLSTTTPSAAYCTFAVTGAKTSFQPIFICHDCFHHQEKDGGVAEPATPLCICQACADICHDGNDHDVEYIGMGPCYCDCDHTGNCSIFQQSQIQAERLLGACCPKTPPLLADPSVAAASRPPPSSGKSSSFDATNGPLQEAFDVPMLRSTVVMAELVSQAQELIRHSKETFWIDNQTASAASSTGSSLCAFELLAWRIYEHHRTHYESLFPGDDQQTGGAEWWVQLKDPTSFSGKDGAIDLHYDKDEALAEVFGLGSFPTLSTVTYLTASHPSLVMPFNPTIVLDHTYTQGEDDMIDTMLVSRPSLGKHLVFDGKLLHGAPAHEDLRGAPVVSASPAPSESSEAKALASELPVRVTFLVNIWKNRPAKVQPLPNAIRQALTENNPSQQQQALLQSLEADALIMAKKEVPIVNLERDEDLPEHLRHRIELPFVSKGATWEAQLLPMAGKSAQDNTEATEPVEDDDDEEEGEDDGLVVVTYPPPPSPDHDTLLVKFGPGLQAYLDYPHRVANLSEDQTMESQRETGYV